jgi:hypothetical protein
MGGGAASTVWKLSGTPVLQLAEFSHPHLARQPIGMCPALSVLTAVLCRYQARELWLGLKNPLERHGVDVACVVHEWRDR